MSTKTFDDTMRENALKADKFGGKRFLGWTPNGKEAWVSFLVDRETLDMSIDSTVNLHLLLEEGAILADSRVQVARGVTNRKDVKEMLRFEKRNQGGDLNNYSIQYMMKIINAVQAKSHLFFDRSGRVNKSALRLVSNAIFTGSLEEDKGFRWLDVIKYWDLPEGTYFTVDALPNIAE